MEGHALNPKNASSPHLVVPSVCQILLFFPLIVYCHKKKVVFNFFSLSFVAKKKMSNQNFFFKKQEKKEFFFLKKPKEFVTPNKKTGRGIFHLQGLLTIKSKSQHPSEIVALTKDTYRVYDHHILNFAGDGYLILKLDGYFLQQVRQCPYRQYPRTWQGGQI